MFCSTELVKQWFADYMEEKWKTLQTKEKY